MTLEDKIDNIEARVNKIEKGIFQMKSLMIGIGIGIVITGIVFGFIGLKELQALIKTVK